MSVLKVVSRHTDGDGCIRELVAFRDSSGKVRLGERYVKSRFQNRGRSEWFSVLREKLKATFAKRMSVKMMEMDDRDEAICEALWNQQNAMAVGGE